MLRCAHQSSDEAKTPESLSSDVITLQPALTGLTATSPYHRKLRRVREKKRGGVRKREECAPLKHTGARRDDG